MVMRCKGGERGRGREKKSLMKPLQKTPLASICTILIIVKISIFQKPVKKVIRTYPLPKEAKPHQNMMGKNIMKNVCVPRFAVIAK